MATEFSCSFCGRLRSEVPKLLSGPRVFICDSCVRDCISLATDTVAPQTSSGALRVIAVAGPLPGGNRPCSFCGDRAPSRLKIARHDSELDVTWLICANCIGLCVQMLADYLGGEWNERMTSWPEAAGE